jgi:hypothetical protein
MRRRQSEAWSYAAASPHDARRLAVTSNHVLKGMILKVLRQRVTSASFVDPRLQHAILCADNTNNEGQLHPVIDASQRPGKILL